MPTMKVLYTCSPVINNNVMKAKPIVLVILTLIIGFILGMLTSAQLRFSRLKPVRFYFSEERFREGFYKIIEPDEKQKAEIEKILDKFSKKNSELHENFRKEADSNMKAFRKEVDAKLTREQIARLKEMDEKREKMIKEFRKHRNDSTDRGAMGPRDPDGRQFYNEHRIPHGDRPLYPSDRPDDSRQDSTISANDEQQIIK